MILRVVGLYGKWRVCDVARLRIVVLRIASKDIDRRPDNENVSGSVAITEKSREHTFWYSESLQRQLLSPAQCGLTYCV